MYSKNWRKEVTDNPVVLPERLEAMKEYIEKYRRDNGRMPSYRHMNRIFGSNGTAKYYRGIS